MRENYSNWIFCAIWANSQLSLFLFSSFRKWNGDYFHTQLTLEASIFVPHEKNVYFCYEFTFLILAHADENNALRVCWRETRRCMQKKFFHPSRLISVLLLLLYDDLSSSVKKWWVRDFASHARDKLHISSTSIVGVTSRFNWEWFLKMRESVNCQCENYGNWWDSAGRYFIHSITKSRHLSAVKRPIYYSSAQQSTKVTSSTFFSIQHKSRVFYDPNYPTVLISLVDLKQTLEWFQLQRFVKFLSGCSFALYSRILAMFHITIITCVVISTVLLSFYRNLSKVIIVAAEGSVVMDMTQFGTLLRIV